jgi:hypothetical protein
MGRPYYFELDTEYPDIFATIKLPTDEIEVKIHEKHCCFTMINPDGGLDLILPDGIYEKIRTGEAAITFQTTPVPAGHICPDGRNRKLTGIRIIQLN